MKKQNVQNTIGFLWSFISLTKADLYALIYKVFMYCTNYVNSINLAKKKGE